MSKVSNILIFIQLLSTGRKYSISELAEILEVTPRMIRVYKEDLEKAGIYIDTIMGPYGGYVLKQNVCLPKIKFKKNDYLVLNKYIEKEKDFEKREMLVLLQNKIKNSYFESIENKEFLVGEILEKYNTLTRAIKEKRKVRILYYSYNCLECERIIEPAEMFLFKNGWYCAAFCELRNDIRHFELSRIKKFELLHDYFN